MFKLAWVTDSHLDRLRIPDAAEHFASYLVAEHDPNALLITGDISMGHVLEYHLEQLEAGLLGLPLYFVLGNHDYYRSSFVEGHTVAAGHEGWLQKGFYLEGRLVPIPYRTLTPNVALVGNEGWYDAYWGSPYSTRFGMTDWALIQEYAAIPNTMIDDEKYQQEIPAEVMRTLVEARKQLIEMARARSALFAAQAKLDLELALKDHEWVVFATHYPPFKEACWHEGHMSGDVWLPWFTSKLMGDMLMEVAAAHPDRKIIVLCGHSHSSGSFQPLRNLLVLTGEAVYGAPDLAGILEIDESGILVRIRMNKHWTTLAPFL